MSAPVIAFDAVGTLIAADPPVVDVYRRAAARRGLHVDTGVVQQRLRLALAERLRSDHRTSEAGERAFWQGVIDGTFPELARQSGELLDELWEHFAEARHWRLYDDVVPAWETLRRAGMRLVIASNFDARLRAICCALPPLHEAEAIFTSSELGYRKPHREFFRQIERSLGVGPQACTLIGDELVADVEGAQLAGWQAAHVQRQAGPGPVVSTADGAAARKPLQAFDLLSLAEIILPSKFN